ncbi:MAG: vWA domain-containing protein [Myxococcota bacterium]
MKLSRMPQRGSYAAVYAIAASALVAFGAIAVDLSMLRLADAEIQAVADASAQAAILELRSTNNRAVAKAVSQQVTGHNRVAGIQPIQDHLDFGLFEAGVFTPTSLNANAVRVDVKVDVDLPFSGFWGAGSQTLRGTAAAAARPLHTIVVVDITRSWSPVDFVGARDGAVAVFDHMASAAGKNDRVGLVVFHGKYGTEFTPLTRVDDAVANGVREEWLKLDRAQLTGTAIPVEPLPPVPLQFNDETGTDHAIGIQMATKMFAEQPDPTVYRAMIIITDGAPADVGKHKNRNDVGWVDTRWRFEYTGATARTKDAIRSESQAMTKMAWDTAEVHTWMVSFKLNDPWMVPVAQGDGYFIRATNSSELVDIFTDIAESLPIALVE